MAQLELARNTIRGFEANGRWYPGCCAFSVKDEVRALGAKWSPDTKRWCAPTTKVLVALIESGVWEPDVGARADKLIEAARQLEEEATVEIEIKNREEWERHMAKEKERREGRSAAEREKERARGIPADEPELVEELGQMGISPQDIARSAFFLPWGPRLGIANARRWKRAIELGLAPYEGAWKTDVVEVDGPGSSRVLRLFLHGSLRAQYATDLPLRDCTESMHTGPVDFDALEAAMEASKPKVSKKRSFASEADAMDVEEALRDSGAVAAPAATTTTTTTTAEAAAEEHDDEEEEEEWPCCEDCDKLVDAQFYTCGCLYREWHRAPGGEWTYV